MDTLSTENLYDGNPNRKMKKRRKSKKLIVKDETHSSDQNNIDTQLATKTAEGNVFCHTEVVTGPSEDLAEGNVTVKNTEFLDKVQRTFHSNVDTGPTVNMSEGNTSVKKAKKQKRIVKAEIEDEVRNKMDAINLVGGNVMTKKPEIKDEVQHTVLTKIDIGSTENLTHGNVNIENPKIQNENQSMYQNNLDNGPEESFTLGIVTDKRKKKKRKNEKTEDEVQKEMDARLTENLDEGNVTIEKPMVQGEAQSKDHNQMENLSQGNVPVKQTKKQKRTKTKFNDAVHCEMHTISIENLADGSATTKMPEIADEVQSVSQVQMDPGSTENVAEGYVSMKTPKSQDEIQNIYQAKMDTGPTHNFSEGNVNVKRRKKRKTNKAKAVDGIPGRMDAGSTENPAGVIVSMGISENRDEVQSMDLKVIDAEAAENISKGSVTIENSKNEEESQRMDKVKMDRGPEKDFIKEHMGGKRKRKNRSFKNSKDVGESTSQGGTISSFSVNGLSQVSNENTLDKEMGHTVGWSAISTCNAFALKDAEALCLKEASIPSIRRKLLVLDLNGLLAEIVYSTEKHCKEGIKISKRRTVFRRPFCDDFLKFCFENFDVGIWSSRSKTIVDRVVDCLLEDQKYKLQFCWDTTHCTKTGFKTLETSSKPLVCKELRKIWENNDPNCPWKKGDYDKSNTLLLDDSPYKALLNPLHTAIFPHSYQYSCKNDNSLGCGGDLRVYLEGLVTSENVQKYVEQHPFGQRPITENNLSWGFYKQVLKQASKPVTNNRFRRS